MKTILTDPDILIPYGVTGKEALAARDAILSGVHLLAFGGKQGSGKDTVAPLVLAGLGAQAPHHAFFARPLKEEVNHVISIIQQGDANTVTAITKEMIVPTRAAQGIYDMLAADIASGTVSDSYQRTPSVRKALQYWGTDVRRAQSENYWVAKAIQSIIAELTQGNSVFLTDLRFPNEADSSIFTGGKAIRLDISPEVQYDRIMKRDNIAISSEARAHVSETALDNYPHFFTRVNVDTAPPKQVADTILERIAKDG